ncbi:MAG TPA: YfiR family protein [Steroidobacteraceae bacterium]|nr:YfiR family protein [Steroidobacteraceae bacterium]
MEVPQARLGRRHLILIRAVLLCVFACVGSSFSALAQAAQFSVDAVKAAYLFRFAQYVEWPQPPAPDAPFVIAVSGAEEVAVHLERLSPEMTVNGRRVTVRRATRVQDLDGVHILFIGASAFNRTRALRTHAIDKPILIVTEDEQGIDGGAVINFVEVNRNLRFEVSLIAADRSKLRINSALLSVAARVERRPQSSLNCNDGYVRRHRPAGCGIRLAGIGVRRGG